MRESTREAIRLEETLRSLYLVYKPTKEKMEAVNKLHIEFKGKIEPILEERAKVMIDYLQREINILRDEPNAGGTNNKSASNKKNKRAKVN